jgi:hypothetical protein
MKNNGQSNWSEAFCGEGYCLPRVMKGKSRVAGWGGVSGRELKITNIHRSKDDIYLAKKKEKAEKSAKALTDKFYILEKEGAEQKIKECIHLVVYGSVFNGIGQKEAEISLYLIQLLEGER